MGTPRGGGLEAGPPAVHNPRQDRETRSGKRGISFPKDLKGTGFASVQTQATTNPPISDHAEGAVGITAEPKLPEEAMPTGALVLSE